MRPVSLPVNLAVPAATAAAAMALMAPQTEPIPVPSQKANYQQVRVLTRERMTKTTTDINSCKRTTKRSSTLTNNCPGWFKRVLLPKHNLFR